MTNKKTKAAQLENELSSNSNYITASQKIPSYLQIKSNDQNSNVFNKTKAFKKFSVVKSDNFSKYETNENRLNMNFLTEPSTNSKVGSSSVSFKAKKFNSQSSVQLRCNVSMQQSEQNKATLLLVVTVLVFLICQVPGALLLIWEAIFPLDNQSETSADIILGLNNIANGLVAINASINFILYSCFSEKFRQTFQRLFFFKKKPTAVNSTIYKAIPHRSKSMGYM